MPLDVCSKELMTQKDFVNLENRIKTKRFCVAGAGLEADHQRPDRPRSCECEAANQNKTF